MVADGDAHILSAVEAGLITAISCQDVVMLQHRKHYLIGRMGGQNLAEEIVRLRWHDS